MVNWVCEHFEQVPGRRATSLLLCLSTFQASVCRLRTDLEQQPLECQAGIPAGHDGVAKRLGCGQAELEHPAVTLQHPRSAPEQLHVGAQLFRGHPA